MLSDQEKAQFLERLWREAQSRGDFPALAQSVKTIVSAMGDENDEIDLTAAVLQDFALTQKVIRLANSPMYAVFGGNVTTVTRALLILGQDTVGHVALSMKLLGSFDALAGGDEQRKRELSRAVLAGTVARGIAERVKVNEAEEASVCTLLHQVGRLMVVFYLPDEWAQIAERVAAGHPERETGRVVLGLDFEEIGRYMAERWHLPVRIVRTLDRAADEGSADPGDHDAWLATIATAATEMSDALAAGADSETMQALAARYADRIGLEAEDLTNAVTSSATSEAGARLLAGAQSGRVMSAVRQPAEDVRKKPEARLRAALVEIRTAAEEMQLGQLVNVVMESLYASLGCDRVVFFMRDKANKRINARSGLGTGVKELLPVLAFPDGFAPDVFHLSLANNRPVFIENRSESTVARRLPQWYRDAVADARGFVLLPLCVNGRPLGMLYADWTTPENVPKLAKPEIDLLTAINDVLLDAFVSSHARAVANEVRERRVA